LNLNFIVAGWMPLQKLTCKKRGNKKKEKKKMEQLLKMLTILPKNSLYKFEYASV